MQLANQKGWALFTMRRTGRNIRALAASVNYARAFHNIRAAVRTTLSRPALQPVLASARGSHERERGQTLIEFAFALPIILLFLMVMVDFGLALDHRIVLQHAVSEGVREAAFNSNLTQIKDTTVDQSQGLVGTDDVEVCYINYNGNAEVGDVGDKVQVSATYTYNFTAGGGDMLQAFGVTPPAITMEPVYTTALQAPAPGGDECP